MRPVPRRLCLVSLLRQLLRHLRLPLLLLACCAGVAWAAPPPLVVPDGQLGLSGCRPGQQPGRQLAALGAGLLVASSFEEAGWSGRLEARALALAAGGAIEVGGAPLWEAGALLNAAAPPQRKIYTLARDAGGAIRTVAFDWSSLPGAERAWLDGGDNGEARAGFLRGERTREVGQPGGVFRRRAGILGDAIHSLPLLVGAPSVSGQGPGYDGFHARYKARAGAIYLGANDGMLHGFDARDGAELFAYVPQALLPFVSQLSDPAYRHRPYVDASAGQGEAALKGEWRSVLVSGMGMGARGVFALDVTDPAIFIAGRGALWEFTEADDPAIGHVGAPPQVAKLRIGVQRGIPEYRYFAIVASGVNNYGPAGSHADAGGALFLLALDKPANEDWKRGVNYYKLEAPAADAGQANALGPPALVIGGDGSVAYAYAGDLQGRLWRFDFSGKPPFAGKPVFAARDASGGRQPITEAPRVVFAPGGGYLVLFGTGKLIEEADLRPAGFTPQSFYAVRDIAADSATDSTPDATPAAVGGRSQLAQRTLSGNDIYTITGDEFAYSGAGAKQGWYVDFPHASVDGERLAASPVLASGTVLVTTLVPGADACNAATRTYVLDVLTGLAFKADGVAASEAATGALVRAAPGTLPMVLDLGAGTGPRGATGGARATRKLGVLHLPAGAGAPPVEQVEVQLSAGRLSWREVANWQELHDAAKK
jgi:type IV pilus assembly protein PilY1